MGLNSSSINMSSFVLECDVSIARCRYATGDHVGVYPENTSDNVKEAAKFLGHNLDIKFSLLVDAEDGSHIGHSSLQPPFPGPCDLRTALTRYADLISPPRKVKMFFVHFSIALHCGQINADS